MGRSSVVAGTGYEDRPQIIKKYIKKGAAVTLIREPDNRYDKNAIAVYLETPRLMGLLGSGRKQIGYIKAHTAKSLSKKMDSGEAVTATVSQFFIFDHRVAPSVSVDIRYESDNAEP